MSNYVEISDIDNFPAGYTEALKQNNIDVVESIIERVTKDVFYAKSFDVVLNGNGKNEINLRLHPNILSITEVRLSDVLLEPSLYSFDKYSVFRAALAVAQCKAINSITLAGTNPVSVSVTNHGFVTGELARLVSVQGITPKLDGEYVVTRIDNNNFTLNGTNSSNYTGTFTSGTACFATLAELHYLSDETQDGIFPRGTRNIKIIGTCGWSSCPAAIKKAAIILCKHENDNSLYTAYSGMASESLGDYSYTKGEGEKFLTGIIEADRLIRNYIRKKPIIGAV